MDKSFICDSQQRQPPTQWAARAYHLPAADSLGHLHARVRTMHLSRDLSILRAGLTSALRDRFERHFRVRSHVGSPRSANPSLSVSRSVSRQGLRLAAWQKQEKGGTVASVTVPSLAVGSEFQEQQPPNRVNSAPNRRAAERSIRLATRRAGAAAATF